MLVPTRRRVSTRNVELLERRVLKEDIFYKMVNLNLMLLSFQVRNAGLLENVSAEQRKFQEVRKILGINVVLKHGPTC